MFCLNLFYQYFNCETNNINMFYIDNWSPLINSYHGHGQFHTYKDDDTNLSIYAFYSHHLVFQS
jgi:hypothetical protein